MPAAAGYVAEKPENIRQIAKLPDPDTSLSEAGKIATSLSQAYSKPPRAVMASDDEVLRLAVALHGPDVRIVALDVGQASCNVVFVGGKPVLYFDAGAPLYHNVRSFPSSFRHNLPDSAFVILSHWDFDHFDLARRKPIMQQYEWFAPAQPVGPNAFKFQERLGDRLHFLTKPLVGPGFRLCAGQATNPKDRNGSGYSLRLEIGDDSILLNGDCPYGQIDPSLQQPGITALTIPHHGGASNSTVPDPQKKSRAVASYGKPNCYKHPSEASLQAHEAKGWNITRTAADPSNSFSRGSRLLFP
jgi:beta-lactamase superfamily II metal-dependent hydrolase